MRKEALRRLAEALDCTPGQVDAACKRLPLALGLRARAYLDNLETSGQLALRGSRNANARMGRDLSDVLELAEEIRRERTPSRKR